MRNPHAESLDEIAGCPACSGEFGLCLRPNVARDEHASLARAAMGYVSRQGARRVDGKNDWRDLRPTLGISVSEHSHRFRHYRLAALAHAYESIPYSCRKQTRGGRLGSDYPRI